QRIGHFCNALERHQLRVDRAIYAINTFLIPSLAYAMAFVQPTAPAAKAWDKSIARTIRHLCGAEAVRDMKPSALAVITGLILPSHYERAVKIREAYIRINCNSPSGESARARWQERKASNISATNRLVRCAHLANE